MPSKLAIALAEYHESLLEESAEDPWELMPRDVLEQFGVDVETVAGRFDGACYFHGTGGRPGGLPRARDPAARPDDRGALGDAARARGRGDLRRGLGLGPQLG